MTRIGREGDRRAWMDLQRKLRQQWLQPCPVTPKNFKAASAAKRTVTHRKSYSSTMDEFSFGPINNDDMNEIDALSAGLLPLLVPGLKVGSDMKITEGWKFSPTMMSSAPRHSRVPSELGGVSSGSHSRKVNTAQPRQKKVSTHKRHHFSLPR